MPMPAPLIGAGHIVSGSGCRPRPAGLDRQALGDGAQSAPSQRVDEAAREADPAGLPFGVRAAVEHRLREEI
ncbi:hypothetical protein GCM10007874_22360 [Labrys miyagiensis]|uniref:Uncharacterized protein n=1 Tax=Labrys miyagiensis TaxID=346912 RepID=A0ABQ6CHG4_9HYPH|nr:hypothetical protein GCM10007874_22360 [Labrys miyagiensis]